jgi:hypothetical protein
VAVVDLNGIKSELKSIFEAANTTTASPIDLSSNLLGPKRVQRVMTVHPEMITPQASFFPFVTSYILEKEITGSDISVNQTNSTRNSEILIGVVGAVWNSNIVTADDDPADTDINYLMENVEQVLRANPTINGKVKWQVPQSVKYYTYPLNQQTHIRFGILTLKAKAFY